MKTLETPLEIGNSILDTAFKYWPCFGT